MASAIVTPPIRTPLTPPEAAPIGRSSDRRIADIEGRLNDLAATRDWWLYWNSLTQGVNQNAANIDAIAQELAAELRSGTHAERLAVAPDQLGALWIETDRNNIVYQAQDVAGTPAWVYVTGAMYGTVIALDQRPTDLGVNDAGLIFLSSDSTSVRWNGGNWEPLGRILDLGAAPPVSQLVLKANGQGGLSFLTYAPDNLQIGFDAELDIPGVGGFKALAPTCGWISKIGGVLHLYGSGGNVVGGPALQTSLALVNLATGTWQFDQQVHVLAGGYFFAGLQVVSARRPGIAHPVGGAVVDAECRAQLNLLLNALSASAGGHGLIG